MTYEQQLAKALRHVHPALRTALLHHVRGEHALTRLFLDEYLKLEPVSQRGDGYINAKEIAEMIVEYTEYHQTHGGT